MTDTTVRHKSYGRGIIASQDEKHIKVIFDNKTVGEKTFMYPDAFFSYIRYEDCSLQDEMNKTLDNLRAADEEKRRLAEEAAAEKARILAILHRAAKKPAARKKAAKRGGDTLEKDTQRLS